MADYITKIRTTEGDKQIDYNALANLPDIGFQNYELVYDKTFENITSIDETLDFSASDYKKYKVIMEVDATKDTYDSTQITIQEFIIFGCYYLYYNAFTPTSAYHFYYVLSNTDILSVTDSETIFYIEVIPSNTWGFYNGNTAGSSPHQLNKLTHHIKTTDNNNYNKLKVGLSTEVVGVTIKIFAQK